MNNDSVKMLLAFAGGAVAGAVAGILLAPDKGSETRKKIINRAKDMSTDLTDAAMDKYDEFMEWKNNLMGEAEQAAANVKDKVGEKVRKAENAVNKVADRLSQEEKLRSSDI
jgi:gas vesicle protein